MATPKPEPMAPVPVTLVTGFLGAGKTSFLNHFIREIAPERVLVIENEVGAVNVDGALVEEGAESVIELTAGCICCSLSDGLLDALEEASARREDYEHLVIETTGVADPSTIVQVFLANPMVERHFALEWVVCLVDAFCIEDWLTDTEEALRQIAMADVVLVNKADTVLPAYLAQVSARLRTINPHALTLTGTQGAFPIDRIRATSATAAESFESRMSTMDTQVAHAQAATDSSGVTAHRISTFSLTFERAFVIDDVFGMQLHRLVNLYRHQVYRIKGVLHARGLENRVILQSVRTMSVLTDGSDWAEGEARVSTVVVIGRGLEKEAIRKMLGRLTEKAGRMEGAQRWP